MLSRVANSLYWMARYIERAENVARLLDVNLQLLLDFRGLDQKAMRAHWEPIIHTTGDEASFMSQHQSVTATAVAEFTVFQRENPNSIVSSICSARENARMIRDQITTETWEELNRLYLFVVSPQARQMWLDSPTDFFNQIKNSSLQIIGISHATHLRMEGWQFGQVGRFIERADKTSRILDVRYHTLPTRGLPGKISQSEALAWTAILRSCSAWDAFKSVHGAEVNQRNVAEMLLLNEDFPRSVRFCVERLNASLREISGVAPDRFANPAEKLCGRLVADLQFTTIEEVFESGLHEYLDQLQLKLNVIGEELYQTYISHAFDTIGEQELVQQEEQQQQNKSRLGS